MSNLKLPKPSQARHVSQQKDKMAANVANHMSPKAKMPKEVIMKSGGGKGPRKAKV